MGKDTFTAGVVPGGLTVNTEIKILICHVLRAIAMPIAQEDLLQAVTDRGYANYFESADALSDLEKSGIVRLDENGCCALTPAGENVAQTLGDDIPLTVRERVTTQALFLAKRKSRENDNKVTIEELGPGFLVRCAVCAKDGSAVFALELTAPTRAEAQKIRDRFLDAPEAIVRLNYEQLTGEPF